MKLEPLTLEDMEQIRIWRHAFSETLRTPYMLTREMQEDYYRNTICNRESKTRYWALVEDSHEEDVSTVYQPQAVWAHGGRRLCGYGGIENISWENSNGEMSLLIDPARHGKGLGGEAVELFLAQAFNFLNLHAVHGECYGCGPYKFWEKQVEKYKGESTWLPLRKYHAGAYWPSYYFTFERLGYEHHMRNPG